MTQEIILDDSGDKRWTQALYKYIRERALETLGSLSTQGLPPRHYCMFSGENCLLKKKVKKD